MRFLGNIIWLIFGGFEAAIGYFTGSLAMAVTIVGIPWAMQTFKIGLQCLWPFGAKIKESDHHPGCLRIPINNLRYILGSLLARICHVVCGLLLCITIIGLPWGKQHFKMAGLAIAPFGKRITLGF